MKELREEIVQLGVDLSLFVAESMFLMCDNIHSMIHFCLKLWRDVKRDLKPCSPVVERLLRVIHYVYSENNKPKNGVYHTGVKGGGEVKPRMFQRGMGLRGKLWSLTFWSCGNQGSMMRDEILSDLFQPLLKEEEEEEEHKTIVDLLVSSCLYLSIRKKFTKKCF